MKKRMSIGLCVLFFAFALSACGSDSILMLEGDTLYTEQVDGWFVGASDAISEAADGDLILVHICGAVVNPGVYELEAGCRMYQLVELAGGFAEDAAEGYLNLAEVLTDGRKVVVPTENEAGEDIYGEAGSDFGGKVNINTADKAQLMTLPGIGEAKALAIIAWRTEHGGFQTTEEIMQVSGIKEAAYEKIKTLITVD